MSSVRPELSAVLCIDSASSANALLTSIGNRSSGSGRAMLRRSSSTRLTCASSRSTVVRKLWRYSRSSNIFTISLQLLPMFWIGCDRSWTRPTAMRPKMAWRSFFLTSSWSSTSLSAMLLNASPSCPSSSVDETTTRSSRWPAASAFVPRVSARIGSMKLRPQKYPTASIANSAAAMEMNSWVWRRIGMAKASAAGCSTMIVQPSAGRRAPTPSIWPRSSAYCAEAVASPCGHGLDLLHQRVRRACCRRGPRATSRRGRHARAAGRRW